MTAKRKRVPGFHFRISPEMRERFDYYRTKVHVAAGRRRKDSSALQAEFATAAIEHFMSAIERGEVDLDDCPSLAGGFIILPNGERDYSPSEADHLYDCLAIKGRIGLYPSEEKVLEGYASNIRPGCPVKVRGLHFTRSKFPGYELTDGMCEGTVRARAGGMPFGFRAVHFNGADEPVAIHLYDLRSSR